jgi:rhodanese-related sulfurtransferase
MDTNSKSSSALLLGAQSVSAAQLAKQLGGPSGPIICDVRRSGAYDGAERVIAGAMRLPPGASDAEFCSLSKALPIVVYCVHGHEVSQHVAARLVQLGFNAVYLAGGVSEWEALGLLTMVKHADLQLPAALEKPSHWVTRERPKIDRIACPWLIRRFIDSRAIFHYLPGSEVTDFAKKSGAIAYDVPNVLISHQGAAGELCSFDALMAELDLRDPALQRIAQIVRGADTDRLDIASESAGLLAVSLGLSRLYPNDDEMLEHGMVIYDALYTWSKSATGEVHNASLFKNSL